MAYLYLQLYSLRRETEVAAAETIKRVRALGYDGVELAGRYDWDAERWKDLLEETGLVSISSHVGLEDIEDRFDETVAFHRAIRCQTLVVSSIPREMQNLNGFQEAARRLNDAGRKLAAEGFSCGYHNHAFEFDRLEGSTRGMDILLAETEPEAVGFQPDTFWLERAGEDAAAFLRKHAARVLSIHAKELRKSDDTDVPAGEGDVDFRSIIPMAVEQDWPIIVEFESEGAPEGVKAGASYLRTLLQD